MTNFSKKVALIIGSFLIFAMSACSSYKTCPTYAKVQKPAVEKKANS